MRDLTSEMATAAAAATIEPVQFLKLELDSGDILLHSHLGDIAWGGDTYTGIGTLGKIAPAEETSDLSRTPLTVTLSNIHGDMGAIILGEHYQGRRATLYLGYMGNTLSPEAAAYIAAGLKAGGSSPTAQRKRKIERLITALKTAGVWDKLDILYLLASHDAALAGINLKNPGVNTITTSGGVTFDADQGYTGDGSSGYLNTNHNPNTANGQMTRNSAHLGVWVNTTSTNSGADIGSTTTQGILRFRTGTESYRLNSTTTGTPLVSDTAPCHIMGIRRDASNQILFANGVQADTMAAVSTGIIDTIRVGSFAGAAFSNRQWSFAHAGSELSDAEALALYDAFNAYMTDEASLSTADFRLVSDPFILYRGIVDKSGIQQGKTFTVTLTIESRFATWNRPTVRRYNNADQQSRYPGDKGLQLMEQTVERTIWWGVPKP